MDTASLSNNHPWYTVLLWSVFIKCHAGETKKQEQVQEHFANLVESNAVH